jgi:hypothetical protein
LLGIFEPIKIDANSWWLLGIYGSTETNGNACRPLGFLDKQKPLKMLGACQALSHKQKLLKMPSNCWSFGLTKIDKNYQKHLVVVRCFCTNKNH